VIHWSIDPLVLYFVPPQLIHPVFPSIGVRSIGKRENVFKERGIDELNPVWNMLDLTPQGRGKFYASLDYGTKVQAARG